MEMYWIKKDALPSIYAPAITDDGFNKEVITPVDSPLGSYQGKSLDTIIQTKA